jgi:hypothetical protein
MLSIIFLTCTQPIQWLSIIGVPTGFTSENQSEDWMSFRLIYEGPLLSSNTDNHSALRNNKHEIRRQFHIQLKQFWQTEKHLRFRANSLIPGKPYVGGIPIPPNEFLNHIAARYERCGNGFVPLVILPEDKEVICSLEILFLRREPPGKIIQGGDIDNRLNTLFDALRIPRDGSEMPTTPLSNDENPMYCLLQDDAIISEVKISTDLLLLPPKNLGHAVNDVVLLLNVDLKRTEESWMY